MSNWEQKQTLAISLRRTGKNIIKWRVSYLFILPFMLIFLTFTVFPVIQAIYYSLTQFNMLESAKWIGLENYKNLFFNDAIFGIAVKNTLLFAAITGPVSYFMCLMLAWFVSELPAKPRAFLTLLFYAPTLANIYMVWQLIFSGDENGILNAWLLKTGIISSAIQWLTDPTYMAMVVILVILWSSLGTSFLSFIAGFQNVDRTLYEAGAVDGIHNRWQELWYITLPVMRPQLMFGAVMNITASFGMGDAITALCGFPSTNYAVHTIMHHLTDYGNTRFQMGYACAIATVLFLIMVLSNQIIQKLLAKVGE